MWVAFTVERSIKINFWSAMTAPDDTITAHFCHDTCVSDSVSSYLVSPCYGCYMVAEILQSEKLHFFQTFVSSHLFQFIL
mmetsp:Transcript_32281/g.40479  ORF Transcript_32281/g.40479 Transcript_32281/m.40479 type:complete len:80 (-) Transcript_32281:114-353(-)